MTGEQYLALIHRCDCVVHLNRRGVRVRCAEAHHIESVRGPHSSFATAPLCKECHDLLHAMRRRPFYLLYDLDDIKLLAWTAMEVCRILAA